MSSASQPAHPDLIARLGLVGLWSLEPVVLASFATRAPMLRIGPNGAGNSPLLERLATAFGLVCMQQVVKRVQPKWPRQRTGKRVRHRVGAMPAGPDAQEPGNAVPAIAGGVRCRDRQRAVNRGRGQRTRSAGRSR